MNEMNLLTLFSEILSYPTDQYPKMVGACRRRLEQTDRTAATSMMDFEQSLSGRSLEQMQEGFIQTFDLNPICALEVGWQLFGDNYDRGEFLVKVRQELLRHGIRESCELPDHLTHLLLLVDQMESREGAEVVERFILPAVRKMLAGMEGKSSPYENVLKSLVRYLEVGVPLPQEAVNE